MHLLYGLAGSGKSTLARQLADGGRAVRFTLDEWMLALRPDLDFASPAYGAVAEQVKELVWQVAEQVLAAGTDVVLDWNSWSVERRRWAIDRAQDARAAVVLHRVSTPVDVASQRALERTAAGAQPSHPVTRAANEHLASLMEEPDVSEGLRICDH